MPTLQPLSSLVKLALVFLALDSPEMGVQCQGQAARVAWVLGNGPVWTPYPQATMIFHLLHTP
ncbi:hypothetical protein BO78DRAFT_392260 [Aspergillus sclerotiicarbonarius CBS 121057]|uniref:Uncharacterized protein n=1 Tax=Aspergillus sclerotiicarbonarius (strain CBS 121057 / IBT 28362) TaxID=1448318 RepID=A0A319F7X7_ASPSB|nr:hypothetical protein BO78DRAFT_392260 [Aspergillus sclerotiicarbonarius CBS 121057]